MNRTLSLAAFAVVSGSTVSLLASLPAQAVGVNFGGVFHDVSVVEMTYLSSYSAFQLPPLGQMPWWGSQVSADYFAEQVYNLLGEGSTAGYGPLFAHRYDASLALLLGSLQDITTPGFLIDGTPTAGAMVQYAIAAAPVPGPLPLFGAAAAFGWSRRLRRRIG
jgi:hypothetical protein